MSLPASLLAVLLAASGSAADVPLPPPPAGTGPRAAPPASTAPGGRAGPSGPRFLAAFGADFGFTDLKTVPMEDGSTWSLTANQGAYLAVGAVVPWTWLDRRLETQATIGLKYTSITASNGGATLLTFPLEIIQAIRLDPVRLGAGIVYLHAPSASGHGVLSAYEANFESSLGVIVQGEWCFGPGARFGFGPRFIWQKLQEKGGGPVKDANATGVYLSYAAL